MTFSKDDYAARHFMHWQMICSNNYCDLQRCYVLAGKAFGSTLQGNYLYGDLSLSLQESHQHTSFMQLQLRPKESLKHLNQCLFLLRVYHDVRMVEALNSEGRVAASLYEKQQANVLVSDCLQQLLLHNHPFFPVITS